MELKPILVRYLMKDQEDWEYFNLKPDEYFDNDEYKKESIFDFIEKEFLEPRNYVKRPIEQIEKLCFLAKDNLGNETENNLLYWGDGVNQLKHTIERSNNVVMHETIIISRTQDQLCYVLRFEKVDDCWDLVTDGTQLVN